MQSSSRLETTAGITPLQKRDHDVVPFFWLGMLVALLLFSCVQPPRLAPTPAHRQTSLELPTGIQASPKPSQAHSSRVNAFCQSTEAFNRLRGFRSQGQMVVLGSRLYFLLGFEQGHNRGRLATVELSSLTDGDVAPEPVLVEAGEGSSHSAEFTNPFGLVSDGTDLYVSTGLYAPGEGGVVRVSQLSPASDGGLRGRFDRIATDVTDLKDPAFLLLAQVDGALHCYWSEYTASGNAGGRVRRARADGRGQTETVVSHLAFPAGLATDGATLLVCESDGGTGGRVLKVPLAFTGRTLLPGDPELTEVSSGVAPEILRPFDVAYDGQSGYLFSEGYALPGSGLDSGPDGQGRIRFLPQASNTARVLVRGLDQPAGLAALDLGEASAVAFTSGRGITRMAVSPAGEVLASSHTPEVGEAVQTVIASPARPLVLVLGQQQGRSEQALWALMNPLPETPATP